MQAVPADGHASNAAGMGAATVSELGATVRCLGCTIFIGIGHHQAVPHPAPDEPGRRCGECHARELRRAQGRVLACLRSEE